ncbi:MAG TPA: nitrogen fixation protein NifH [Bacillota bacterium]|nr:nitrogen fixation protein NifH [Bacillota bacterium]
MKDWKSVLKADSTEWLLEKENPSVRYFTLTQLLDQPENHVEVKQTKSDIMKVGVVPEILTKMAEPAYWENSKKFYTDKYRGLVWQLVILAELGADVSAGDPGGAEGYGNEIRKACEFLLENSQDRESGGFSMSASAKSGGGRHSEVIPCLTGNLVWSLLRLGYGEDPRIQRGIDWIINFQRFDDGAGEAPQGWPYDKYEMCWGKHTCHMGVVKSLKALAEIPSSQRTQRIRGTIEKGAEYLLIHHIHKRSHNLNQVSRPGWLRFSFPLMYQTDILEILEILTRLGYRDPRMEEAITKVISKQDTQGRWLMVNTFNGRFLEDIEEKDQPSKWLTLRALMVLKRWYQ